MRKSAALCALIWSALLWYANPVLSQPAVDAQPQPPTLTESEAALSQWNDGKARQCIIEFVTHVTNPQDAKYLPVEERIAVFDNDGTLICEQPAFFQMLFTHDSALQLARKHPEWQQNPKLKAFLELKNEQVAAIHGGEAIKIAAQCRAGLTEEDYEQRAHSWLQTARHPKFNKPYQDLIYRPMLQLMDYLRANGFKVYICSGGTTDFIRCYSTHAYGLGLDQIIGSSVKLEFKDDVKPSVLTGLPDIGLLNVGRAKPIAIYNHIGRRPVIAVGNSNGDMAMLAFATDCPGLRLGVLVHHDDPIREYAYDKGAEAALKAAADHHWLVVSMKNDFKSMFASSQ